MVAADENEKRRAETHLAPASWLGRASSMGDALYRLELDMACY